MYQLDSIQLRTLHKCGFISRESRAWKEQSYPAEFNERINATRSKPAIEPFPVRSNNYRLVRAIDYGIIVSPPPPPSLLSSVGLKYTRVVLKIPVTGFKIDVKRTWEVSEREARRDSRGVTPRPRPVEERKKISRGRRRA